MIAALFQKLWRFMGQDADDRIQKEIGLLGVARELFTRRTAEVVGDLS